MQDTTSSQDPSCYERTTFQTDDTNACTSAATCDRAEGICLNCAVSMADSSINQHLDDFLTLWLEHWTLNQENPVSNPLATVSKHGQLFSLQFTRVYN